MFQRAPMSGRTCTSNCACVSVLVLALDAVLIKWCDLCIKACESVVQHINVLCSDAPFSAQDHVRECNFVISPCPNGCEFRANRKAMMDHLQQCPNKTTACPFCKVLFSRNKLQVRTSVCVCACVCACVRALWMGMDWGQARGLSV